MRRLQVLLVSFLLAAAVSAQTVNTTEVAPIALAYTPTAGACPAGFQLVRAAGAPGSQTLGSDESAYVDARRSQVLPGAWAAFLANVQHAPDAPALPSYVSALLGNASSIPTLGIATSGGGYRPAARPPRSRSSSSRRSSDSQTTWNGSFPSTSPFWSL